VPVCTAHPGQGASESGVVPSRGGRIGKRGFRVQVRVPRARLQSSFRDKNRGETAAGAAADAAAARESGIIPFSESNPSESDSDDSEHRLQKTPSQNMLTASGSPGAASIMPSVLRV
jgi:hypothetical protein